MQADHNILLVLINQPNKQKMRYTSQIFTFSTQRTKNGILWVHPIWIRWDIHGNRSQFTYWIGEFFIGPIPSRNKSVCSKTSISACSKGEGASFSGVSQLHAMTYSTITMEFEENMSGLLLFEIWVMNVLRCCSFGPSSISLLLFVSGFCRSSQLRLPHSCLPSFSAVVGCFLPSVKNFGNHMNLTTLMFPYLMWLA